MENRSIVIISMINDFLAEEVEFPVHIPYYFWKINKWQNLAQYLVSIATDFRPKQIWIITSPNLIPAMKLNLGEIAIFRHRFSKNPKAFSSPKRNIQIPIYYWAHPDHLTKIRKKEQLYKILYLANRLHETYKKIILSQQMNKFIFLDSSYFFDSFLLGKFKKHIVKNKNCLINFKHKNENKSFLDSKVLACLDISQIKTILKYYDSIKKIDGKSVSHKNMMSCIDHTKFDCFIDVEIPYRFYSFKTFSSYASYLTTTTNEKAFITRDHYMYSKNIINLHKKKKFAKKRFKFIKSTSVMTFNVKNNLEQPRKNIR